MSIVSAILLGIFGCISIVIGGATVIIVLGDERKKREEESDEGQEAHEG